MKITRNLPEQLILDHTPWVFSLLFGGMALVFLSIGVTLVMNGELFGLIFTLVGGGVGGLVFFMIARRVQLILDAEAGTITLRRRTLLGYSEEVHALADLREAILEETTSSKGGRTYRPSLYLSGMSEGIHPILKVYTNTGGPRTAVNAINTWLDSHRADIPPPET
ncbi:MAG: hypothetical protein AB3N13_15925 [Arenibacterium sp.]